jgi:hypothetical protein
MKYDACMMQQGSRTPSKNRLQVGTAIDYIIISTMEEHVDLDAPDIKVH